MTDTPARYRRKPVEVEAVQWDGSADQAVEIVGCRMGQGAPGMSETRSVLVERYAALLEQLEVINRRNEGRRHLRWRDRRPCRKILEAIDEVRAKIDQLDEAVAKTFDQRP